MKEGSDSGPLPRLVLGDGATGETEEGELASRLFEGRLALWRHPRAVRSALNALIAEGRRFAHTDEVAKWKARLAGSDLVRRGRLLWEVYGFTADADGDEGLLPSAWLDAMVASTGHAETERLLMEVILRSVEDAVSPNRRIPPLD